MKQNVPSCFIALVNADSAVAGVTLADFWSGDSAREDVAIPPAYTLKGKEAIDDYIKELETALNDPLLTTDMNREFQENYKKRYLDAWESFGSQMPNGIQQLAGKKDWLLIIDRIALGQDPYFSFLARLKNETAPFAENSDRAWIGPAIKLGAAMQDDLLEPGPLSQSDEKEKSISARMEKTIGDSEASKRYESRLKATAALGNYREALAELSKAAVSGKDIHEIAAKTFAGESKARCHHLSPLTNRFVHWKSPSRTASAHQICCRIWYPAPVGFSGIFIAGKPPVTWTGSGKKRFWLRSKGLPATRRSKTAFREKKERPWISSKDRLRHLSTGT